VVKRKKLAPEEMPETLHWFKWEAYMTWISGIFLLGVVYFFGRGVYLLDPSHSKIGLGAGIAVVVGLLIGGYMVYDALWKSPLARTPAIAALVSFGLIVVAAYGLTHLFSGRAAYLLLGATLGSIMANNVSQVIVPAQRKMIAATRAGEPVDLSLGERAKMRSTHNHYMTLPVLFMMLSNHFPATYGHPLSWVVLILIVIFGAAAKYVMNERGRSNRWIVAAGIVALAAAVTMTARASRMAGAASDFRNAPRVDFATAHAVIERRCVTCHSAHPTNPSFPQPPSGIVLEDPRRIHDLAPRIMERAVVTKTMPLGNLTGMTEDERSTLGAWIAQGARIDSSVTR
jgi:uncharacterized membrane protein